MHVQIAVMFANVSNNGALRDALVVLLCHSKTSNAVLVSVSMLGVNWCVCSIALMRVQVGPEVGALSALHAVAMASYQQFLRRRRSAHTPGATRLS
jgi:hypothetical protein